MAKSTFGCRCLLLPVEIVMFWTRIAFRLIEIYEIDFVRVLEQGLPLYTRHQFRGTMATGSVLSSIKSGSNKLWVSLQP